MSNAYVIEVGDDAAGVVIREGHRFRFYSSSRRFWSLDGSFFRKPEDAERAALSLLSLRPARSAHNHSRP